MIISPNNSEEEEVEGGLSLAFDAHKLLNGILFI